MSIYITKWVGVFVCICVCVCVCVCVWKNEVWEQPCPQLSWALTTYYTMASSLCLRSKRVAEYYKIIDEIPVITRTQSNSDQPEISVLIISRPVASYREGGTTSTKSLDILLLSWCDTLGLPLSSFGIFSMTTCFGICLLLATIILCVFSSIKDMI